MGSPDVHPYPQLGEEWDGSEVIHIDWSMEVADTIVLTLADGREESLSKRRRPFAEVQVGEVIHDHGVPFEITQGCASWGDADERRVVWMVGTYTGEDMGPYPGNRLAPFVRRAGDTWTFQRREEYAHVYSFDGVTWFAPY